ncbi:MAG: hypothetical protein DRR08_11680 [Candidatus Parabeggiatoa sp. nov. 2]|nr:MAG: hypothetical protein B6247_16040 [Beggiatoa sp. 4572_84]RKZ60293.1 MAG: hypothetical protein DRR08_11680 [Gammaproteobacteria bacterium]
MAFPHQQTELERMNCQRNTSFNRIQTRVKAFFKPYAVDLKHYFIFSITLVSGMVIDDDSADAKQNHWTLPAN